MKKAKQILMKVLCFALVFVMGGGIILSAFSLTASAEETAFDINTSSPLEDLQGATIDGSRFSVAEFNSEKINAWKVITMYEYGYSADSLDYFNLYFYLYVPNEEEFEGIRLDYENGHHAELKFGDEQNVLYYPIEYVNHTVDPIFGGVFSKFKLSLKEEELHKKWCSLTPEERVYSTSALQFLIWGDTNPKRVSYLGEFSFSGYMQGLDRTSAEGSTLVMKSDRKDTLHLDVRSTFYDVPFVNNDDGNDLTAEIDSNDRLHSVYFSIPNHLIKEYGEMTAVTATWREALLSPALVAGDNSLYEYMKKNLDQDFNTSDLQYLLLTDYDPLVSLGSTNVFTAGYLLGFSSNMTGKLYNSGNVAWSKIVNPLRLLFKPEKFGEDAADKTIINSEAIQEMLSERTEIHSNKLYSNPYRDDYFYKSPSGVEYYKDLFESIAEESTLLNIKADDTFPLTGQIVTQSWWQRIWWDSTVKEFEAKHIKGIQKVTKEDFTLAAMTDVYYSLGQGNALPLSALSEEVRRNPDKEYELVKKSPCVGNYFYISDSADFVEYFEEKTANDETVYLLRYRVSDYLSEEATVFLLDESDGSYEKQGTNAYVFQMEVDVGFDVLDVTLSKDGVDTVIPVVMEAVDIFHDAKPPVNTTSDAEDESFVMDLLKIIMFLVIIVVVFIALSYAMPFVRPLLDIFANILKTIFSLLLLPFRAIGNLFKRRR